MKEYHNDNHHWKNHSSISKIGRNVLFWIQDKTITIWTFIRPFQANLSLAEPKCFVYSSFCMDWIGQSCWVLPFHYFLSTISTSQHIPQLAQSVQPPWLSHDGISPRYLFVPIIDGWRDMIYMVAFSLSIYSEVSASYVAFTYVCKVTVTQKRTHWSTSALDCFNHLFPSREDASDWTLQFLGKTAKLIHALL